MHYERNRLQSNFGKRAIDRPIVGGGHNLNYRLNKWNTWKLSLSQNYWWPENVCFGSVIKFQHIESNVLDWLLQLLLTYLFIYSFSSKDRNIKYIAANPETTKSIVWHFYRSISNHRPTDLSRTSRRYRAWRKRKRSRRRQRCMRKCMPIRPIYLFSKAEHISRIFKWFNIKHGHWSGYSCMSQSNLFIVLLKAISK